MTKDAMASGSAIVGRWRRKIMLCLGRDEAVLIAGEGGGVNGIVARRCNDVVWATGRLKRSSERAEGFLLLLSCSLSIGKKVASYMYMSIPRSQSVISGLGLRLETFPSCQTRAEKQQ